MRIVCALGLLLVGFGHQPIASAQDAPLDIAAYALPDGSLPILCVTVTDDTQKNDGKHTHAQQGCDACRISASVLLPSPPDTLGERLQGATATTMRPFREVVQRRIFSPSRAPRAPPLYRSA